MGWSRGKSTPPQHRRLSWKAVLGAAVATTLVASLLLIGGSVAPAEAGLAPALNWAWLGDSYSAGVGVKGGDGAPCYRNPAASWAPRAVSSISVWWRTSLAASAACSGAKLDDIYGGSDRANSGSPQVSALSSSVNLVTLTGGGNDLGFATIVAACVAWRTFVGARPEACPFIPVDDIAEQPGFSGGQRHDWDALFDELVFTYVRVRRSMRADGVLFVNTYPLFFADPATWPTGECDGVWSPASASRLNQGIIRLGDTIYQATQRANQILATTYGQPGNVVFVDQRATNVAARPWEPNGLCGPTGAGTSVNGLSAPLPHAYHPTFNSYGRAAATAANVMNATLGHLYGNPFGSFDQVSVPAAGQVAVRGWAVDPNVATSAIAVHVYVGGPAGTPGAEGFALVANTYRPDVGAVFAGVGSTHGFDATLVTAKTGAQVVCAYAINVGPGDVNTPLGCRTVTLAGQPVYVVMNTSETPPDGVYFRDSPHTADTRRITGLGVYQNERVQVQCFAFGDAVGPYGNRMWYRVVNVNRPTVGGLANAGYLNTHYVNDGMAANQAAPGLPAC